MLYTDALVDVRARLQELTADFWTDAECYAAINEGITRFWMEEKWPFYYTSVTNGSLAASTDTFALAANVSYERHFNLAVTFSGDSRLRLPTRVSPNEGFRLRQTWYNDASEPVAYYIVSQAMASGAFTATIRFVPAMTRAATIEYQYLRRPTLATSSYNSTYLDIPAEYLLGALAYATGHLFLKELQFSQKSEEQFALYHKAVLDAKTMTRKLLPDTSFTWGKTEPQWGYVDDDVYTQLVTPPTLGP